MKILIDENKEQLSKAGLRLAAGEPTSFLTQPCSAHINCRCTVYEDRPQTCRSFKCSVLKKLEKSELGYDEALELVENSLEHLKKVREKMNAAGLLMDGNTVLEMHRYVLEQAKNAKTKSRKRQLLEIGLELAALVMIVRRTFVKNYGKSQKVQDC